MLFKLTISMLFILFSISITLFVFKNSLYFTMFLLCISVFTLRYLVLNTYLTSLTAFIIVIVYVGAIIVLIGYICAITPNLILEPDYSNGYIFTFFALSFYMLERFTTPVFSNTTFTLRDYFYSFQGLYLFLCLVLILFITLLIVTSQYSVPHGPFRSLQS